MSARDEALALIEANPLLRQLLEHAEARLAGDPGHDREHALRVAGWTLRCAEPGVAPQEAIAAALLHDIVNLPKDHPRRAEASVLSAGEARRILEAHGVDGAAIERIARAIEDHSYSRGHVPESALGRALQDADRLEALGVLGVFRTLSTGARMGARYFDPEDPWAEARPLDDRRFTVDHFFTKLLRLPETMQTEPGRVEARRRSRVLERLLDDLADELGRPRAR